MERITNPLSRLFVLSLLSLSAFACGNNESKTIHVPKKVESTIAPTGSETIWSRVCFGSYPSAEIVSSSWNAIDEYALLDGDVIKDDSLYQILTTANWADDKVVIDNASFVREKILGYENSAQHYRHDGEYHYFKVEPLKWRVLAKEGSVLTLLCDRAPDRVLFNEEDTDTDWSRSSLRSYLNDEKNGFIAKAFSKEEQALLRKANNENKANPDYDTSSGPATEDKVYILSNDEVFASEAADAYGFYPGHGFDDPAKRFTSTPYAKFHGAWWSPVSPYRGNSFWCMRTSGYTPSNVTYICDFGYIYSRGTSVACDDAGVVPVIKVDASNYTFNDIDEVSSLAIMKTASGQDKKNTCDESKIVKDHEVVTFGSYPQDEVVRTLPEGSAEGYVLDAALYENLAGSNWDEKVIIDDVEYKNIDDHYFVVEPIKWKVLEKKDGKSLLFPLFGLDCVPYHDSLENTYWSDSSLRAWLNEDFLNEAFSEGKDRIEECKVINENNFYFDTACGETTRDKVFLLSEQEVFTTGNAAKYGFACSDAISDPARQIKPTRYALARGAWESTTSGNGFWMLRTNGYNNSNAVYIGDTGDIFNRGIPITCKDAIVMPALWCELPQ